jgi:prepilin-type N-terminal cleavage/methylation domain-containing protein
MSAFTLIELLTVMAVIAILAGLILSISGYANKKAAIARSQGELAALQTALENFKSDNGIYPHQTLAQSGSLAEVQSGDANIPSDELDPKTMGNSESTNTVYANASLELYEALTSDLTLSGTGGGTGTKNYMQEFRQDVYGRNFPNAAISSTNQVMYISDPFGNCYGYSTANATAATTGTSVPQGYSPPTTMPGYNSTYDLWSTGGAVAPPNSPSTAGQAGDPQLQWIKNW